MADPMTKERIAELRAIDDCCDEDTLDAPAECLDEIERLRAALDAVAITNQNRAGMKAIARAALEGK